MNTETWYVTIRLADGEPLAMFKEERHANSFSEYLEKHETKATKVEPWIFQIKGKQPES